MSGNEGWNGVSDIIKVELVIKEGSVRFGVGQQLHADETVEV